MVQHFWRIGCTDILRTRNYNVTAAKLLNIMTSLLISWY